MGISGPCYDKPHRCPGWAGGGMRYATTSRCDNGRLSAGMYDRWAWQWRTHRCVSCRLLVLPYAVRHLDPRWWGHVAKRTATDIRYRIQEARRG